MQKNLALSVIGAVVVLGLAAAWLQHTQPVPGPGTGPLPATVTAPTTTTSTPSANTIVPELAAPISNALARITKKPFGIKISPANSPVQPEKFSGYHTGVDFETFPSEATTDVPISTICNGPVRLKKYATGYGGVLVQQCELAGQTVTVIYGHLKLSSITVNVGDKLAVGSTIGLLGKGYSTETDGERKHLHLGIHKGASINILGYVQQPTLLSSWIDFEPYLKNG